jgi:hypothetical protein
MQEKLMLYRNTIGAAALAAAFAITVFEAAAFDDAKYPDWKGAWIGGWTKRQPGVTGQPSYDQSKSDGKGQQAPLTPEYQAILEASLADQAAGGPGADPQMACLPPGMPRMMIGYWPMEIVITPDTTHLLMEHIHNFRRIYTDGRDWPAEIEPSFAGYSIGRWIDTDGDGRYDVLEVETRGFKGPRVFDSTGLPLHADNQTIVKERIYRDPADPNTLYDEMVTFDHALTRPWRTVKSFWHDPSQKPVWREFICMEANPWTKVGNESYFQSADGRLMPTRKDQPPPDLSYFNRANK